VDWPIRAQDTLARFRVDYGRHVGDSYFVELIERLNSVSPEFAQWWPRHDIRPMSENSRQYNHPVAGRMLVDAMTFSVADNPEVRVFCLLPAAAEFDRQDAESYRGVWQRCATETRRLIDLGKALCETRLRILAE
jgi:transcription regulator MmyB-like protein